MADQLLSQADVDALVSSLRRSEPARPVLPPLTAPARAGAPATTGAPVRAAQAAAGKPVTAPTAVPPAPVKAGPVARPAQSVRPEARTEVSAEMLNTINARIVNLTRQLAQMGTALKRIDLLEKKAADLETKIAKNKENPDTALKVQELSEAVKKISTNLKGTPGYGVRNTFNCEKCSDHGHVAVMYRCTKCGHERWYGWWPEKK